MTIRLAVLNSMLHMNIKTSLLRQRQLNLVDLDLKDEIFGHCVLDLSDDQAEMVSDLAAELGMSVHCLSTQLFGDALEHGEAHFREQHLSRLDRALRLVEIFRPRMVRLLACQAPARPPGVVAGQYLAADHSWILTLYRDTIAALQSMGVLVVIENEVGDCVLADPDDVLSFFAALEVTEGVGFTWDVQNMWAMGAAPSADVYRALRPVTRYVHLKGGRADEDGSLRWRSSLRDASWPVRDIMAEIARDGISPVVCLNPSHGAALPGYDEITVTEDNIRFLRQLPIGAE